MCGLLGFIGESKIPELTRDLTTSLFVKTQIRGTDASGFYCTSNFSNKDVFFYKEPLQSSVFVENKKYKSLWDHALNLGIFHCRAATQGVGLPSENKNNHPFVSRNFQQAIIHNGFINKTELKMLKTIFETETDCDSELVLRILEQKNSHENNLVDFFALTEKSAFAVAYASADESQRNLTLLRNHHRPLCVIDLKQDLGQYFFCSTPDLFFEAIEETSGLKSLKYAIAELHPYQVLQFELQKDCDIKTALYETEITTQQWNKSWEFSYLENPKSCNFAAKISVTQENDNPAILKDENYLEDLESALINYLKKNKKRSKSSNVDDEKIYHHAKALQALFQSNIL